MAVIATPLANAFRVYVQDGTSGSGTPKTKSITLLTKLVKSNLSATGYAGLVAIADAYEEVSTRTLADTFPYRLVTTNALETGD